mmetsp:Transcript_27330/g.38658  ORF Transcript_27330/g.38658 Transcript_27330/m.38658 type:complete len:373 (-) Transcript_27330:161-1279(-)
MHLVFQLLLLLGLAIPIVSANTEKDVDGIVEWVRSKGGFFSEKLVIRPMIEGSSALGVYAVEKIEKNEVLMKIPKGCYLRLKKPKKIDTSSDATEEDVMTTWHANYCKLAKKLKSSIDLGDGSDFAPYTSYLKKQQRGQTPATWSEDGKILLRKLLPDGHDAVDWIDTYHKEKGCFPKDDAEMELLVSMVIQRGYDSTLVPIWDMVNHDNGRINTATNSLHDNMFKVWATKPITEGSEIYHTYDLCTDCGDTASYWGTPEILRDFGFVEDYPQRWVFWKANVYFEIRWDAPRKRLELSWDMGNEDEEGYGVPSESGIEFMKSYLEKLSTVEIEKETKLLPTQEGYTAGKFYHSAKVALEIAVQAALAHGDEL